jgi:hypothetical protein
MFIGWHGDPCTHCLDSPTPGRPVQRATHGNLCPRHYLAATPAERAVIALEDHADTPRLTTQVIALELLLALPDAPEPHERAA